MGKVSETVNDLKMENSERLRKTKRRYSLTTTKVQSMKKNRTQRIVKSAQSELKKIMRRKGSEELQKKLKSALNIRSQRQVVCSAMNIPSIQNMISMQDLKSYGACSDSIIESNVSFVESCEFLMFENQPQLMLTYLSLIQKALKNLGIPLPSKQNEKVIKGIWNLLIKYWFDIHSQEINIYQYANIGEKVQWGLFQLLNFDLKASKKSRFFMQNKITSLTDLI